MSSLRSVARPSCRWPTSRDVAELTELDRKTVSDALSSGRTRWRKRPDLTAVRNELLELLARRGGIAGADELAGNPDAASIDRIADQLVPKRADEDHRTAMNTLLELGEITAEARRCHSR